MEKTKTFNLYLKARAFKYMKRVIVAVMVLLSLDMPADIAGPMIAASLLGGQVLTAQTKAKKAAFAAMSVIALTFAFPVLSALVKVGAVFLALSLTRGKNQKYVFAAAIAVVFTFFFPLFDVIVKVTAAFAVFGIAGAYDDASVESQKKGGNIKEP